jgi:hypothetical protein
MYSTACAGISAGLYATASIVQEGFLRYEFNSTQLAATGAAIGFFKSCGYVIAENKTKSKLSHFVSQFTQETKEQQLIQNGRIVLPESVKNWIIPGFIGFGLSWYSGYFKNQDHVNSILDYLKHSSQTDFTPLIGAGHMIVSTILINALLDATKISINTERKTAIDENIFILKSSGTLLEKMLIGVGLYAIAGISLEKLLGLETQTSFQMLGGAFQGLCTGIGVVLTDLREYKISLENTKNSNLGEKLEN